MLLSFDSVLVAFNEKMAKQEIVQGIRIRAARHREKLYRRIRLIIKEELEKRAPTIDDEHDYLNDDD